MSSTEKGHAARPYQVEILQRAKSENTVVCLGTGTGKTFISVMLIKEKQGEIGGSIQEGGKRTFFLVNTVPLVYQQQRAIADHTSLKVGFYSGDMGVDFWNKTRWQKEFNENDVLVLTAQILLNIITHAFISLHNINLLILDECHNASKGHPYNKILELFKSCQPAHHPHIMGLTASIINEKYKKANDEKTIEKFLHGKMKALEGRMRSVCITCADPEATAKYATKPVEMIKSFEEGFSINDYDYVEAMILKVSESLDNAYLEFDREKKLKKRMVPSDQRNRTPPNQQILDLTYQNLLTGSFMMRSSDAFTIAADAVKYCKDILQDLGPMCAYEAAKILLGQIEKHKKKRFRLAQQATLNSCSEALNSIISKYEECVKRSPFSTPDHVIPMEPFVTRKVHVFLRDILWKERNYFRDTYDTEMHAIIFVQRRCTAVILSKLINFQVQADFETFEGIWSDYVLGHGLDSNIQLADSYMKSKEQNKILEQFKKEEFNILVATSVVEEGLDVRKCNLVVRFDGINNYREYVQSKGRARAQNSKFIVLAKSGEAQEMKRQLKVMQTIEKVLFENCQNRDLPTEKEIEEANYDEEELLIPTYFGPGGMNAARITRDTAVPLLYRYCSKLPCDQYTNTNPIFDFYQRGLSDDREFQAKCSMPLNCPLQERSYESNWMPSKDLAKKYVALCVCKKLHEAGELDDENLLPVKHNVDSDESEEDESDVKEGTRKSRAVYNRKVPNSLTDSSAFNIHDSDLYAITIRLSEPSTKPNAVPLWPLWYNEDNRCFGIFLPKGVPKIPAFELFTKAGTLNVELFKLDNTTSCDQVLVKRFHKKIVSKCSAEYVTGNPLFNIHDKTVTKGLLTVLRPWVSSCIHSDRRPYSNNDEFVDTSEMHLILGDGMKSNEKAVSDISFKNAVIRKTYLPEPQGRRQYYVLGNSDVKPREVMEGSTKTYEQYYLEKYQLVINPNDYLLDVVSCGTKITFAKEKNNTDSKKQKTSHKELLVPELCVKASELPADLHLQLNVLPFSLYYMEYFLLALQLKEEIAEKINISTEEKDFRFPEISALPRETDVLNYILRLRCDVKTSPSAVSVLECLSTRQAKMNFDLERLEMLGDSFLKQAITIYLFFKNPQYHEGKLSSKRKNCISNKNLSRIAKDVGLPSFICNSQFGCMNTESKNQNPRTVWLPPGHVRAVDAMVSDDIMEAEGDDLDCSLYERSLPYHEVQDKSLADCVEAMIGLYLKTGGVNLALKFMQKYLGLNVLYRAITNTDQCKVQNGTQSCYADYPLAASAIMRPGATEHDISQLYNQGKFLRFEDILGYSFTDKSYLVQAMTHLSYIANDITGCYQQYEFLGDSILDFLVTLHVYIKRPELSPGELTSIRSALVNNNTFALLAVKHDFYKFLLQWEPALFSAYDEFVKLIIDNDVDNEDGNLEAYFKNPFVIVPSGSEVGYHAPKVLGDLFESVAGAIFLDCNLSLETVWEVYYPILQPVVDRYLENIPLNPARELMEKYTGVEFRYTTTDDGVTCQVEHDGQRESGIGKNKKIAKSTAARRALDRWKK
ncbi:endoribonuclease Dicer-like isoform X2 [Hydractinia symbiolongicarpus]|nr:endoribonuclease Dicer-like isoform X2 [Hydractinia symbiolongicarpus]